MDAGAIPSGAQRAIQEQLPRNLKPVGVEDSSVALLLRNDKTHLQL